MYQQISCFLQGGFSISSITSTNFDICCLNVTWVFFVCSWCLVSRWLCLVSRHLSNSAVILNIYGPSSVWGHRDWVIPTAPLSPLIAELFCSCAGSSAIGENDMVVFLTVKWLWLNSTDTFGCIVVSKTMSLMWFGTHLAYAGRGEWCVRWWIWTFLHWIMWKWKRGW